MSTCSLRGRKIVELTSSPGQSPPSSDDGLDGRLDVWWVVTLAGVLLVVLFIVVVQQLLAVRRASAASGQPKPEVADPDDGGPAEPEPPADAVAAGTAEPQPASIEVEPASIEVEPASIEVEPAAAGEGQDAETPPTSAETAADEGAVIIQPRRAPLEPEPLGADSALASLDSGWIPGVPPRAASGQVLMPLPRTAADDAEQAAVPADAPDERPAAAAEPVTADPGSKPDELPPDEQPAEEPPVVDEETAVAVDEPSEAEPDGVQEVPAADVPAAGDRATPQDGPAEAAPVAEDAPTAEHAPTSEPAAAEPAAAEPAAAEPAAVAERAQAAEHAPEAVDEVPDGWPVDPPAATGT